MTTPGITKRIGSIKFSCVSPEEIRKMSATKVITADTYDEEGYPIEMGLMDPHMGVIEPGLRCKTCGCKVDECPGHFGHIDLAMPVIPSTSPCPSSTSGSSRTSRCSWSPPAASAAG